MPKSFRLLFVLLLCLAASASHAADKIYITGGMYVMDIDTETGDRHVTYFDDWPRIISVSDYAVDTDGSLLLETSDALLRRGIYRLNPTTGVKTPVSGGVDGFADELLGNGPEIRPGVNSLVFGTDSLFGSRTALGPLEIDLTFGDRRIVSNTEQTTGTLPSEVPMISPQDMAMLDVGNLLVADRFDGMVGVNIATGARRHLAPPTVLFNPVRFDRLDDGRVIFPVITTEAILLFTLDLRTGEEAVYSGKYDGVSRGSGPDFEYPGDLTVDAKGRLWVYDFLIPAIFRVDPDGTRTIISSNAVGAGVGIPAEGLHGVMGTYRRAIPPVDTGTVWVVY